MAHDETTAQTDLDWDLKRRSFFFWEIWFIQDVQVEDVQYVEDDESKYVVNPISPVQ